MEPPAPSPDTPPDTPPEIPPDIRTDRRYTSEHEWALRRRRTVLLGVTPMAAQQMLPIYEVTFCVERGDRVTIGQVYAQVQAHKYSFDILSPLSGQVAQVHRGLCREPAPFYQDSYGRGWLLSLLPDEDGIAAYRQLLDAAGYRLALRDAPPLRQP